jgi:Fur family ferric uptake transcriptional regulator
MSAPTYPVVRLTKQRKILLEELSKLGNHPTACELFEKVRTRIPRIGMGSIYRNLDVLSDQGVILKLEVSGTQKRFDAVTEPHYHIRCSKCSRVDDITLQLSKGVLEEIAQKSAYRIYRHTVEVNGECPDCQAHIRADAD